MGRKRSNGEGTIFKRADGRWATQVLVTLIDGRKKRVSITKKRREDVKAKMNELLDMNRNYVRLVEKKWTLNEWMDYWLENVAKHRVRPSTFVNYEVVTRKYIKPLLGHKLLVEIGVRDAQLAVDAMARDQVGGSTCKHFRQTLSVALNRAVREELIVRNAAQYIELPKYEEKEIIPWTVEQAIKFLDANRTHMWYPALLLQLTYGMRRGEVLGLRWADIDWPNNRLFVRQQLNWFTGKGTVAEDVKTKAGRRELPLVPAIKTELTKLAERYEVDLEICFEPEASYCTEGTVIKNRNGCAVDPNNYARTFDILIKRAGVPRIKNHAIRHTTTTLLKRLGVPIKDIQIILGHADMQTTQRIYTHGCSDVQIGAIEALDGVLSGNVGKIEERKDSQAEYVDPDQIALDLTY